MATTTVDPYKALTEIAERNVVLQARLAEAEALVREMDADKTHNRALNEKVRAFLKGGANG